MTDKEERDWHTYFSEHVAGCHQNSNYLPSSEAAPSQQQSMSNSKTLLPWSSSRSPSEEGSGGPGAVAVLSLIFRIRFPRAASMRLGVSMPYQFKLGSMIKNDVFTRSIVRLVGFQLVYGFGVGMGSAIPATLSRPFFPKLMYPPGPPSSLLLKVPVSPYSPLSHRAL